jgi:hypothetical protein
LDEVDGHAKVARVAPIRAGVAHRPQGEHVSRVRPGRYGEGNTTGLSEQNASWTKGACRRAANSSSRAIRIRDPHLWRRSVTAAVARRL